MKIHRETFIHFIGRSRKFINSSEFNIILIQKCSSNLMISSAPKKFRGNQKSVCILCINKIFFSVNFYIKTKLINYDTESNFNFLVIHNEIRIVYLMSTEKAPEKKTYEVFRNFSSETNS